MFQLQGGSHFSASLGREESPRFSGTIHFYVLIVEHGVSSTTSGGYVLVCGSSTGQHVFNRFREGIQTCPLGILLWVL